MKRIKYIWRNVRLDVIASLLAIVSTIGSFYFAQNKVIALFTSVLIIFIALIVILYFRLKGKDFYFIQFNKREDKDDWLGRGKFEYFREGNCFLITDSESGFIYSKCLNWSDYNMTFEFKIANSCLGVVVRAINLSNYIMLQIRESGIRPHIRINGGWRAWEAEETNLKFPKNLTLDRWYKCVLSCEKDSIGIKLYEDGGNVFNREWVIPHGMIQFEFKEEPEGRAVRIPFPINLEYGTVGFRNSGTERALTKDVLVEKT